MYICEYTYVYKEVPSVSTRFKVCTGKGRDICDLAQLELYTKVFIIRYDICILVDICMYTKRFKV